MREQNANPLSIFICFSNKNGELVGIFRGKVFWKMEGTENIIIFLKYFL